MLPQQLQHLGQVGGPDVGPRRPVDPGGGGRRAPGHASGPPAGRRPRGIRGRRRRRGWGGTPCSGRGCPRSPSGRSRWGRDRRARAVQRSPPRSPARPVPPCAPPSDVGRRGSTRQPSSRRTPACSNRTATRRAPPSRDCTGCSASGVPRPSEVTTSWPAREPAGSRHELTAAQRVPPAPSDRATMTAQAPHSPSAQPSLAPVSPRPRSQSRALVHGSAPERPRTSPLTVTSDAPPGRHRAAPPPRRDHDAPCPGAERATDGRRLSRVVIGGSTGPRAHG